MSQIFDLFGEPVPANWGKPGRPEHTPTTENSFKIKWMLALGWSNKRIAETLDLAIPTLRKHYSSDLAIRDTARDRLVAGVGVKLLEQVEAGNVAAIKELWKVIERNDLMQFGQTAPSSKARKAAKPPKLGKKEAEKRDANTPDTGTTLGELMARRQGAMN